jgi:head-tail adaptor
MSTPAGRMDRKVTFLRRAARPAAVNTLREGFVTLGQRWAAFREMQPAERSVSGFPFVLRGGTLTVHDTAFTRSLSASDRVLVSEIEYEIQNIATPVVRNGDARMTLLEAPTPNSYSRQMEQRGEEITIRRIVPNQPPVEAHVRAMITGYDPEELVAGINQGDRRVLIPYADLVASGLPLPLREGSTDRVIVRGRAMIIAAIDDSTHRVAGTLNAVQLRVTG